MSAINYWDGTKWVTLNTTGATGAQGPRGDKGDAGAPGADGAAGQDGAPGADGISIRILGSVEDPIDLPASPNPGDAYIYSDVAAAFYGYLLVYTPGTNAGLPLRDGRATEWVPVGRIVGYDGTAGADGPEGPRGPNCYVQVAEPVGGGVGELWIDPDAVAAGADCGVSADADNVLVNGTDGKAYLTLDGLRQLADGTLVRIDPKALVLVFDTTFGGAGVEVSVFINQVTVTPDVVIDWGDGTAPQAVNVKGEVKHTYATAGLYIVSITGAMDHFGDSSTIYKGYDYLQQVLCWGDTGLVSLQAALAFASNMNAPIPQIPETVTDTRVMLAHCRSFNQPINHLDLTRVKDVALMLFRCRSFNVPVRLNLASATTISRLFGDCSVLNSTVELLAPLAEDASQLFSGCSVFNRPVALSLPKVKTLSRMFESCSALNATVTITGTTLATDMSLMFTNCASLNSAVSINSTAATDMANMFGGCTAFNQPVAFLNTSKVTNMSGMFAGTPAFTGPLAGLDYSALSSSTALDGFKGGPAGGGVLAVEWPSANYDALLLRWATQLNAGGSTIPRNMRAYANARYSATGKTSRDVLTTAGWVITDGGQV